MAGSDYDINGLLKQAIRFSASLNSLALEAERDENEEEKRVYSDQWPRKILEETCLINDNLAKYFRKKIKISETEILTTSDFLNERYASNFGLLAPTRLSDSLNTIKAKLLDLETLKKSQLLIKPEQFELIIGTPSLEGPILSEKSIRSLKESNELIEEIAHLERIGFFKAENARFAAEHLVKKAA